MIKKNKNKNKKKKNKNILHNKKENIFIRKFLCTGGAHSGNGCGHRWESEHKSQHCPMCGKKYFQWTNYFSWT